MKHSQPDPIHRLTTAAIDRPTATIGRRGLLRMLAGGAAVLALGFGRHVQAASADIRFFRIGTGAPSGTYFPLGGEMANALSNPPGSRDCAKGGACGVPGVIAIAQASQGSVENVEAVEKGQFESALCQADVASWAYAGSNAFAKTGAQQQLRALANLYSESLHIVVRADGPIHSLKDLKGKRISLGEPESGTLVDARLVLAGVGLAEKDLKASFMKLAPAAAGLVDGTMDGFFQIAGWPVPAITELAQNTKLRLLPIPAELAERLRKKWSYLAADRIPAGSYNGIDEDVETIGIGAEWITTDKIETDFAYRLVKALWHESSQKMIENGHPIGKRIKLAHAIDGLALPLHPGAEQYYREVGLLVQASQN
jgi:TRAP transporter TAXI family solute receptor